MYISIFADTGNNCQYVFIEIDGEHQVNSISSIYMTITRLFLFIIPH